MSTKTEHQQHDEEDMHTTLEKARADAKQEFEQERDSILKSLPAGYRSMFGAVVFAKWRSKWLPCLVLSPYMVPPGPVRDKWMGMFHKLSSTNRTNHFSYLVYWYGADASQWYSFITRSSLTTFEELAKKKHHFDIENPPKGLESAYKELAEDIPLQPHERKRGDFGFKEGYELVDEIDYREVMGQEPSPKAEPSAVAAVKKAPAKATSKKKGGKKHARSATSIVTKEEQQGDVAAATQTVPKKKKRTSKRGSSISSTATSTTNEPVSNAEVTVTPPDERDFKMCEMSYKSLVENWRKAVDQAALERLLPLLSELNGAVGQFSTLFVERRNLPELVERTASLLAGGETKGKEAKLFEDFRRRFDARYAKISERQIGKSLPSSEENADDVVEKMPSSEDDEYVPATTTAQEVIRTNKRANKKAASSKEIVPVKKKTKVKHEKVGVVSKVENRAVKFKSINKKFMSFWKKIVSSSDVQALTDLLNNAVFLASNGKVTAKFINDNQIEFKDLTKRSKNVLKDEGQDMSVLKTLKAALTSVFRTGEMEKKTKPSTEETASKELPADADNSDKQEQKVTPAETTTPSDPTAEQQKTSRTQMKKKRTIVSLGSILSAQAATKPAESPKKIPSTAPNPTSKPSPLWYSTPCTIARQKEDPRLLGTEFLEQMVLGCLPGNPNQASIAIQLEAAVFELCEDAKALTLTPPPAEHYFERVHKLIAGCCGMKGPTEHIAKLVKGEFPTPRKFVETVSASTTR